MPGDVYLFIESSLELTFAVSNIYFSRSGALTLHLNFKLQRMTMPNTYLELQVLSGINYFATVHMLTAFGLLTDGASVAA